MPHGSEVYRDLQHHASTSRREVEAIALELQALEKQAHDVVAQRSDCVRRLAQHYLPALDDQSIARAASEVQGQLRAVQDKQQADIERLRAAIAELAQTLAAHEAELAKVTAQLDDCVRRRTELEGRAAKLLEADPEFKDLATRAADTERKLARDEERAQEIAREAAAKLPAYERSRLFQYLVRREYGTPQYRAGWPARRLDRWVAEMVDFARVRPSYDFLRVTPQLVAAEVTRRREEFAPIMAQLQAKQARASAEVGLPAVLAEGEKLGADRDQRVAAMTELQNKHRAVSEELAQAESNEGKYYGEALATFRAFLERAETRALEQRARITPEPQDDALVAEIATLRQREGDAGARLAELSAQRTTMDARAVGLERLVRRFREANFDATRSRFDAFDLGFEVQRYLDGKASVDELWNLLRNRQRFEQAPPQIHVGGGAFPQADMSTGSRVLLEAMGHVVGAALRSAARGSVLRGGFGGGGGGFKMGGGRGGGGGFTRGRGF
jgi:hypothetical protein